MAKQHDTILPRRKRSARLTLALMGAGAASILSGCGNPDPTLDAPELSNVNFTEPEAYRSVDECVADNVYTRNACEAAYNAAQESTPRFASVEECEAEYGEGNCNVNNSTGTDNSASNSGGGSWVGPALMGYMVGNMMANRNRDGARVRSVYHEPIYRTRENRGQWGAATSQTRQEVTRRNTAISSNVAKANTRATQRSGFGSRSSARGGFGS